MDNLSGKAIVAGLVGLVAWNSLGEERKRQILSLPDRFARAVAEAEERKRQQLMAAQAAQAQAALDMLRIDPPVFPKLRLLPDGNIAVSMPGPGQGQPSAPAVPLDPDARWRGVIIHPSIVLVLGKRGSGKSALSYRLLELFRYVATPYVVGVSAKVRSLLPDWIGICPALDELPAKSVAVIDEAYLHYHARSSMARESKAMSQLVNLSKAEGADFDLRDPGSKAS